MESEAKESVHTERILEERKKKIKEFFSKRPELIYISGLILIILFGAIFIRTAPIPYLKDVTTNNWTLGPDLDPFLFLRLAQTIVENGSLPTTDYMRYVPLGFNNKDENYFLQYTIAYLYKFLHFFDPGVTVEYAAIVYPVIAFAFTLVFLFLFVRRAFRNQGRHQSNIAALIACAFLSVIPAFLHRSVAGIAEKEPAGMMFMFATFYFFLVAWQSEKTKKAVIFGILSGISTWLMGMFWGGVVYVFVIIAMAALISFFFNNKKKDFLIYSSWLFTFTILLGFLIEKYGGIEGLMLSTTSGFAYLVFVIMSLDIIIMKTNLKSKIEKLRIPHQLFSVIVIILLAVISILVFAPSMIEHISKDLEGVFIQIITNRLNATVAENNQPFFDSWIGSFTIGFFWLFVLGSILMFNEVVKNMRYKLWMTGSYVLLLIGVIFSRYSSSSIMNGSSSLSIFVYVASFVLFSAVNIIGYLKEHKENKEFSVDKFLILALSVFFFSIFEARSGIRYFHVLIPAVAIAAAFIVVKLPEIAMKNKDDVIKKILGVIAIIVIIFAAYSFYNFATQCYNEALYSRPSSYNAQWQYAMSWVRENTPTDAVFAHWWDYGYWVQTMGERATVLDGGNSITYWDHLMGRHVLTGQNETEALEFLKVHNTNYLLIDSTDIGKYPAYSSIAGDENYDRYSWMSTFNLDERQTTEKRNETTYVYTGGTLLDQDIQWQNQIFPAEKAAIVAFILNVKKDGELVTITQPDAVIVYNNKQTTIPVKCVYMDYKILNFSKGFGCLDIIPQLNSGGINKLGSALYISDKSLNALWVKLYLLNYTEGNFELVHSEDTAIIKELQSKYNMTVGDFITYGDVQGPIKIWKINYPENISIKEEYLLRDYPNPILSQVRK